MKILAIGLNGLVGSRIAQLLSERHEFKNISISGGVDVTNKMDIAEAIKNSDAQTVLHLAAKTNVDGCEEDKSFGHEGEAWKINVIGTENVVDACNKSGKKIIYISTDFVFDGEKNDGLYSEDDIPNPINWYGTTKYEGEKIVEKASVPWIIMRIAYPYRAQFEKKDFFRAMFSRLENKQEIAAVTDHVMSPTFIDDIAHAFDALVEQNAEGLLHVVGSGQITPYDAVIEIAKMYGFSQSLIKKTTRQEYFKNGAPRPFKLGLGNARIDKLGIKMRTFREGIEEIKRQL